MNMYHDSLLLTLGLPRLFSHALSTSVTTLKLVGQILTGSTHFKIESIQV